MIGRSLILFLVIIVAPTLYLDVHYRRRQPKWKRTLYWLPTLVITAYTIYLATERNFVPDNIQLLYIYLLLLGLIVIPQLVYALCSICGLGICRLLHKRRNYGNLLGLVLTPVIWFVVLYGTFFGFGQLEVHQEEYHSADLPAAFDGYRIVLFSDAHVGTYTGQRLEILQRAVNTINELRPDLIVFTGDLQNTHPSEIYRHLDLLSSLEAKDGVCSVLGNHDYAEYVDCDEIQKTSNCRETIGLERQMGWHLLLNENMTIQRDSSRIVIAGMENDGDGKRFPQKGDIQKTLNGVSDGDFTIMLEHDPSAWRRKIIPDHRCQLTLSGHTHKMQFALFGWCPMSLTGREVNGWYTEAHQSLFVTAGLGGLIPWRFGAPGEIVVLTLKKSI